MRSYSTAEVVHEYKYLKSLVMVPIRRIAVMLLHGDRAKPRGTHDYHLRARWLLGTACGGDVRSVAHMLQASSCGFPFSFQFFL